MVNEQIVKYIDNVISQGYPEQTIKDVLTSKGWQMGDIDEAFNYVKLLKANIASQAPVSPTLNNQHTENKDKESSIHSPFSYGLAIVLVGAVFILLNKIISDSSYYTSSINAQLVFDVLIIIPFLLIAFILHESFSSHGKRFLLVSQPYFLVSAFLLVRLLWDTSKYILDANVTYGVYVVLVMIILVLTGSILFVQKYIKS